MNYYQLTHIFQISKKIIVLKIKRTLQPYAYNGKIQFGFGNSTLIREIPDTPRNRSLLLSTDLEKVATTSELDRFKNLGLVTDNPYNDSRYSRNINFFEWIDESSNISPASYQEKLLNSSVLIVGIGGIGGTIAESLTRLGVGKLILVDFDVVDESNLTRQSIYNIENIQHSKIEAARNYLHSIGETHIEVITQKISTKPDLEKIYTDNIFDLAICSADTPQDIDFWFDDLSAKYNIPFIAGSYASTVINYACIIPNITVDLHTFYAENKITDDHLIPDKVSTSVIAPITFMAAGLISYKVFAMLTGLNNMCNCIQIDVLTWDIHQYDISLSSKSKENE